MKIQHFCLNFVGLKDTDNNQLMTKDHWEILLSKMCKTTARIVSSCTVYFQDVLAYKALNIPMFRIFTINHKGELRHELSHTFQSS